MGDGENDWGILRMGEVVREGESGEWRMDVLRNGECCFEREAWIMDGRQIMVDP